MNNYSQSLFPYKGIEINDSFKTDLFPYQLETVEWMLYREEIPVSNIRGGFVFSDMGVGKTICGLACTILNGGKTLIVVPAQVVYVWESEIKRHFNESIKYFVYHGMNRRKRLEKYILSNGESPTIIITSYTSIIRETDLTSPIRKLEFYRIIYDECHYIKNVSSEAYKSVSNIQSTVKWFLSGTPILNRVHEIYPYLKLFKYTGLGGIPKISGGSRYTSYTYVGTNTYRMIQDLLKQVAIRKTKELLVLPTKDNMDIYIRLSEKELDFYNELKIYSKKRIQKLFNNLSMIRRSLLQPNIQGRLRLIIMQNMLELVYHLRVACCDPILVINKIPRLHNLDLETSIDVLRKETTMECKVCYNNTGTIQSNVCGHFACGDCWKKLSKINPMICFICHEEISASELKETKKEDVEKSLEIHKLRVVHRSTKTEKILELIKKELNEGNKIVIVSQWTSFLDLLIKYFKCSFSGEKFIYLNGKVTAKKRQTLVDDFQSDINMKVCFASLGSSAEGITLHSACSMIIADVFWNKAKMSQMSDRIHRIGQKMNVRIYNLYVLDSIEMKLKELVEKKDVICRVIVDCVPVTNNVESWLTRIIKLVD